MWCRPRARPLGERKPEQASAILDFYRNSDGDFWKRKQAAVKAAEPLPVDPKLTELQNALTQAEEPIHLDPGLVQLREDAKASGRQNENKRLTVVQDLTWALINSPVSCLTINPISNAQTSTSNKNYD
jgi:hypothetical protein